MLTIVSCGTQENKKPLGGNDTNLEEFGIEELGIEINCPKCKNEMVNDPNSLPLAEAKCGAMLECGKCEEITSWSWTLDPFKLNQIPNEWGGSIECE